MNLLDVIGDAPPSRTEWSRLLADAAATVRAGRRRARGGRRGGVGVADPSGRGGEGILARSQRRDVRQKPRTSAWKNINDFWARATHTRPCRNERAA
jgi:hypothetical protein